MKWKSIAHENEVNDTGEYRIYLAEVLPCSLEQSQIFKSVL